MRPILTDICWTLYRSNTTFDFLDATITAPGYHRLRRWSRNALIRRLNIVWLRLTGHDAIREKALRYLNVYSPEQVEVMADRFVREVLSEKKIQASWDTIADREVVLVSGTIPPIARAVARVIGTDKVHAGDIFKRHIRHAYPYYDIITDNLTDIPLVRDAEEATIILYKNQSRWQKALQGKKVHYIEAETERY